jgi:branched-chain amino acid transport system substrate-binding protein
LFLSGKAVTKMQASLLVVVIIVAVIAASFYISSTGRGPSPVSTQVSQTKTLSLVIKIGASLPLTGGYSSTGQDDLIAYQHGIDQINAQGGIYLSALGGSAKLQLVYYDDTSNPATVTSNMQRLVTVDNVDALLGGWSTPLIVAGARVAQSSKVPFVAVGSTDPVYDRQNYTYTFLPFGNLTVQSVPLEFAAGLPASQRPQKVAIWAENSVLGAESADDWKANIQKYGFQLVYSNTYEPGTKDYSTIILATKQAGAEVVLAIPSPPDGVTMVLQMKDLNFKPALLQLQRAADTSYFANTAGAAANGVVVGQDWAPSMNTPGNKELVQFYVNKTGRLPGTNFGEAYVCIQVLAAAIQKAGSLDKNAIRQALSTGQFETVEGVKSFPSGFGHANRGVWMVEQWQNGTLQVVWPSAYASAPAMYPRP